MEKQLHPSAVNQWLQKTGLISIFMILGFITSLSLSAQQTIELLQTRPALTNNTVVMQQGDMLEISVPATVPGSTYRIQRTWPQDNAFLEVTSTGGLLKVPAFRVNSSGKQIITVSETGNGTFAQSFTLDAKAGLGMKAGGQGLFAENTGGLMYGPMSGEVITAVPALQPNTPNPPKSTICSGGFVYVTISGATDMHTYRLQQTTPSSSTFYDVTANGTVVNFPGVNPTAYATWTITDRDNSFSTNIVIDVVPQPSAPVLTKSPTSDAVCSGTDVSATIFSNGSDGVAACADSYQYRTNNGTWSDYTPGDAISTTGFTSVDIRALRSDNTGAGCSSENIYSWTVNALPVPVINGPTDVCANSIQTYTTEAEMQAYSWIVTGGTGSSSTNSIDINWGSAGPGQVEVNYADANGCNAAANSTISVTKTDTPSASSITLRSTIDNNTWQSVNGDLSSGFNCYIYPCSDYTYLDVSTFTASTDILQDYLHPFHLNQTGLPSGWNAYWAAKGVVQGATGWQGVMYEIINGNQPIFYLKKSGSDYLLIDGLLYKTGQGEQTLRISGDYPLGAYTYDGDLHATAGCYTSLSIGMTFERGILNQTLQLVYGSIQAAIDGSADGSTIEVCDGTYSGNITVNKNIILVSKNGAAATILDGDDSGSHLGTITLTSGRNGVVIGQTDKGFTIKGIDGPPGLEKASVYLQGTQQNITIEGNILEARGDAALMGENNAVNNNITINNNQITGQTFDGTEPATGDQFTVPNVARQAVVFGGGSGTTNTGNFIFTNNTISTIASGILYGNGLVTLDLVGTNIITGNTFSGTTLGTNAALRARGTGNYTIQANRFVGNYTRALTRVGSPIQATCNWWGTDNYQTIYSKVGGYAVFVPYLLTDEVGATCAGGPALPGALALTYTEANEDILVAFNVTANELELQPVPGLNPSDPNYLALVTARYNALAAAIQSGVAADIQAAALAIGDDIITEYYYMDGTNKVYLNTINTNDLVKNKYWDKYLVGPEPLNNRYPDWANSVTLAPIQTYRTHTNPGTGSVAAGWLNPALGRDVYVTVTFINNGYVNSTTQSVAIPAGCIVNTNTGLGYPTIQAAIDATETIDGHVIEVCPGTFNETVTINKSIHLKGQDGETDNTIIAPPLTLPVASDPLSSIIIVSGSGVSAEISGLTIQGPGPSGCGSIGRGVFVRDGAYANIHDNNILDIRDNAAPLSGCQNGIAIQVGRQAFNTTGVATIENNLITGYQKGAIVVDNTGSSATISSNTITGIGTTAITAQNGIQISRGATATISNNTVSGNSYNASTIWDWGACGILLYQSGAVALTGGNTLSGNDNNYYAYGGITGTLALGAEIFGPSTAPVTKGYQILVDENINIDASLCTFEGISPASASLTQLFAIEDRIWHSVDDQAKTGFVKVKSDNVYVTPTETAAHIQNGIDAASSGWTVNVASGNYGRETASNRFIDGAGPYQFGLFIDKENLKVQGYTATNTLPTMASEASVEFTTAATNNFGYSGVYVLANGVSLNGLKVGDNYNISNAIDNNKTIEVTGENFTIERCWINTEADGGALYMGIRNSTNPMTAFTINENRFENALVSINNGVGIGGDLANRKITNNEFSGVITPYIIGFRGWNGAGPVQGWIVNPVGGAVITGNTFSNTGVINYIVARGNAGGYVNGELNWNEIWTSNTFGNHVVTLADESTFDVRSYNDGSYPVTRRISPKIQENVTIGQTNDAVMVSAGTFNEDVNIAIGIKLLGQGYANTTVVGQIGGDGATIRVSSPNVIIDGFSITRAGNNPTDWNNAGLNFAGIAIQGQTNNAEVRNCSFYGNRTGIDVNNSNGNNIHNNLIDNNRTGLLLRNQTDNTILTNNFITNNWTVGVLFLDASGGTNSPVQSALNSQFNDNNISGNWYGDIVDRQEGGSIPLPGTTNMKNFECNWYGTTLPVVSTANSDEPEYSAQIPVFYGGTATAPGGQPNILGPASANFDYVSYYLSGGDGVGIGFQPTGTCDGSPVVITSATPGHIICGETSGSITITFSGGFAPYGIIWTGGSASGISSPFTITGLPAGLCNFTITDSNGSTASSSETILLKPVTNTTQGQDYVSIQAAIDAANAGDVIAVCAGIYAEDITVDLPLDIRGPNYLISPNGGTRVAEAIIVPATSDPNLATGGQILYLENAASGTTLSGFIFDGDNQLLTSGVNMNGANVDALEAISGFHGLSNITIKNNIIRNLNYCGIDLYNYYNSGAATTGNIIEHNLFDNILPTEHGIAVLIYNNCYTTIANNEMTRVRVGVQTGNFYQADPGNSRSISNNNIQASRRGIFHNLAYSNASTFTLSGNTITALNYGTETVWDGILLSSLSVPSTSYNNTINGSAVSIPAIGYQIWNVKNTYPALISGGTITGVSNGVFANNFEGYTSNGGDGAHASLSNISITPIASGIGLRLHDNPSSTHGNIQLTIGAGVVINGGTNGLVIKGGNALMISPLGNLALNDQTGKYIELIDNANDIDATAVLFDGKAGSTMSNTELFATEDKIDHKIDLASLGFVTVKADNAFVTANSFVTPNTTPLIQRGIDAASAGFIVNVAPGTFAENLNVNKGVTLKGANAGVACGSRTAESILAPASGVPVTIGADGVTLNGFELTAPSSFYGIIGSGYSNQHILFNNIHDVGTTASGANVHSIINMIPNGTATENVTIADNCFNNISSSLLTGYSASAIGILQSSSTGTLTGLNIERNTISNVNVNTGNWPTGKIAYGIIINVGSANYASTNGKVVDALISANEISGLSGFISTGIALEGNTEDAIVQNNYVANLSGNKVANRAGGGYDLQGLKFETNRFVETCTVANNSFATDTYTHGTINGAGYAVANYVPSANGGVLTLGCNWYGTEVYNEIVDNVDLTGRILNKDGCETSFVPYLVSGADNETTTIGFQPTPGTCEGEPVVIASAVPAHIYCGGSTGSILVNFSGGSPNYNIDWGSGNATGITGSPYTISGLGAGSYTITVTDTYGSSDMITAEVLYLPVTNVSDMPNTYYPSIQAAIDATTTGNGEIITVCAGTYAEDIIVNKSLDIRGPNYGISPNGETRVAEAIIVPATSDPDINTGGQIMYLENSASGSSIKGFTFDGDNPVLTSGVSMNGADVDVLEAISGYDGLSNVKISNNIIKNLNYAGIDFYNYTNSGAATTGNTIENNLFDNIVPAQYGVAVLIYNNCYTNITNNVMTRVRVGIQTGNFYQADPGNSRSISNNNIQTSRRGIFHNLAYSNASTFTISGNSITASSTGLGTDWDGILLSSLSVPSNSTNNTITGPVSAVSSQGYEIWNVKSNAPASIIGGSVTGVDIGVFANNFEGYSSNGGDGAHVVVSGVTITPKTGGVGVKAYDSPSYTGATSALVSIEVKDNCSISGAATGILAEGADASVTVTNNLATITGNDVGILVKDGADLASVTGNTITDNTHGGIIIESTAGSIGVINNNIISGNGYTFDVTHGLGLQNATTNVVDATNNFWGDASGPYNTPYNTCGLGNAVVGPVDFMPWWTTETGGASPAMLVQNITDPLNIKFYCTIQDAINDAGTNNTIVLSAGNYLESDITIDKDGLILQGAGQTATFIIPDPTKTDNHDCSPLGGIAHHGIIIQAQNVTIQDLTVDGGAGQGYRMGITTDYWSTPTYNDATIEDVTVTNIYYRGIVLRKNGSITTGHKVLNATVTNGGCDVQGFAILGFNADDIEIKDCHVEDWTNGIATGNYTGTFSACDIQDNTVVDVQYQAYTLTLNGAGSTFDGNTATFSSAFNEGTALVTYQDEITLTNNTFTGAKYGISVGYQTLGKDKLVIGAGNVITGPGTTVNGSIGIDVSDYSWAGAARNFTMTGTTVTGYETGVFIDPQSGMTCNADINLNKIYGNAFGIQNDFATAVNATQNWWGANTGPTYSGNPCGTGDAISANVLYDCWKGDATMLLDICQLQAFTLTGNSSICAGGTADITLSGSQTGVQYDLYKDGTLVSGESKTGTGNPLIWTVSTGSNATYTVKATNLLNGCTLDMTGSTRIFVGPITTIGSVTHACVNGMVTIPVTVESFEDVGAISLTLNYDPSELTYLNGTVNSTIVMNNIGISNPSPGVIRLYGFIQGAELPVTLADHATLMNLSFTYLGGTSEITFDDVTDPDNCNYGSGAPLYVSFCDYPTSTYYINGTITEDLTQPTALCQNITIQLDATGNATITPAQIDYGSTDNCGIASLALDKTAFTCADIATNPNPVILTVTDNSGNSSTCNATVTVQDVTPPTAVCQNITVQLDATGNATITASQIDNGSSDACGIASMTVSPNTFNCNSMQVSPVLNDLIISEYVEGSSNNKYIEIYNGTSSAVNLADYELHLYANGSASPSTLSSTLSGTLASGANIVYRNSSATVYTGTTTSLSAINFNGNDAVALYKTSTASFVDIFGVIGDASQPNWSLGGNTTINKTLRRNPNVTQGITVNPSGTGAGAFTTLATEWTQYDQDDVSGLGSHSLATSADNPVTLTVTDANGNSSTCNATVTVVDFIDPEITCPADITQDNDPGNCGAVVNIIPATATDNCTAVSVNGVRSDALALDAAYPVGETTITWTATDPSGNTASCAQTVTITDNEAPIIACPANVTVQVNASSNPAATGFATATDNCSTAPVVTFSDAWAPGSCTGTGVITRTWTATDESQNTVNCEQTITVTDTYTPAITCPADITLVNDPGLCSAVATFADPVSYDPGYNEGWESSSYINGDHLGWTAYNSSVISVPSGTNGIASASGSFHGLTQNPVSSYTGIFSRIGGYTSSFGNGFRVRQAVYMNLADPAVIANTYGWDLSCASSNQSGGHLRDFIFHTASNANGEILVAGSNNSNFARRNDLTTLNHFTITTSGWYIFEFVFRDNTGALAVDLNLLDAGGTVLWTETRTNPTDLIASVVGGNRYLWFTFLAVDNLAIDNTSIERLTSVSSDYASGFAFPVGTTEVTYTSTDVCGNDETCTFTVAVTDNENPTVTASTEIVTTTSADGTGNCTVAVAVPDATYGDNCSSTLAWVMTGAVSANGTGQVGTYTFPIGETTITYTVTDGAGLTANDAMTVTVTDDENPTVTAATDVVTTTSADGTGNCTVAVAITDATFGDNCSSTLAWVMTGAVSANGAGQVGTYTFPIGVTTITYTVTDGAGLTANDAMTVTVTDDENPTITCPTLNNPYTVNNGCTWTGEDLDAEIGDNCSTVTLSYSLDGGISYTNGNLNGYAFPIGTTDVVYRATDASGNIATCSFSIIVQGVTISGNLNYNNPSPQAPNTPYTPMNNVTVILRQGTTDVHSTTTGASGDYTFTGVCAGDYDVIFTTGKPVGGINSSDAAQVNAWGVGPQYTIEKVRFFAGDVNRNNYLQSSDAGQILNYFVTGGATPFNPRWTFWRAGETTITQNPLPNVLSISVPAGSAPITQNYYGMVTGDFNMSFVPGGAKSVMDNVMLNTGGTTLVDPGVEFELPVTAGMDMEIGAISLIIDFPADKLEVTGVYLGTDPTSPMEYALVGEELRVGWNALIPMTLTTGETLLTLKLRTTGSLAQGETIRLSLTADPLNELADGNYNTIPNAQLYVDEIGGIATGVPDITFSNKLLLECYPNPFVDKTTFAFALPRDGKVVLEMADMLGSKTDILLDALHAAGSHTLTVDMSSYSVGIYTATLRLHTGNDVISRTIKVIRRK